MVLQEESAAARRATQIAAVLIAAVVVAGAAACDERKAPAAPDARPATMTIEIATTVATRSVAVQGPFTYQVSVQLGETTGVGVTISHVAATVTELGGAATVTHFSSADAFGTTRVAANGTLMSTGITVTAPLATASEISVRVAFFDDRGNVGSVETSTAVKAEFAGEWFADTRIT